MTKPSTMGQLVQGAATKSEKMRRLAAAGFTRQQIADFLGVRYQFVRNVLVEDEKKRDQGQAGLAEAGKTWAPAVSSTEPVQVITVGQDGSAIIPAFVLAGAGLRPGDSFIPDVAGEGDIRLLSGDAALKRAQELIRQSMRGKASLVDEILRERRRDAGNLAKDIERRRG